MSSTDARASDSEGPDTVSVSCGPFKGRTGSVLGKVDVNRASAGNLYYLVRIEGNLLPVVVSESDVEQCAAPTAVAEQNALDPRKGMLKPPYSVQDFPGVSLILGRASEMGTKDEFSALACLSMLFAKETNEAAAGNEEVAQESPKAQSPPKTGDETAHKDDPSHSPEFLEPEDADCSREAATVTKYIEAHLPTRAAISDLLAANPDSYIVTALQTVFPQAEALPDGLSVSPLPSLPAETIKQAQQSLRYEAAIEAETPSLLRQLENTARTEGNATAAALLWLTFVLANCTVDHVTPCAAPSPESYGISPEPDQPAAPAHENEASACPDAEYGKVGWAAENSGVKLNQTLLKDLEFLQGHWTSLEQNTLVAVQGTCVRFKVAGSEYASEWMLNTDSNGIRLLGSHIQISTSTTTTIRWDDGDVWSKVPPETANGDGLRPAAFGLTSPPRDRELDEPSPQLGDAIPPILPHRPASAPPHRRPSHSHGALTTYAASPVPGGYNEAWASAYRSDLAQINSMDESLQRAVFDQYVFCVAHLFTCLPADSTAKARGPSPALSWIATSSHSITLVSCAGITSIACCRRYAAGRVVVQHTLSRCRAAGREAELR